MKHLTCNAIARLPRFRVTDTVLARLFCLVLAGCSVYSAFPGASADDFALLPCPFHLLTGSPCPGCGMTRACLALCEGDPAAAWRYHPFSFALVGLALAQAVFGPKLGRSWRRFPRVVRLAVSVGALCLVVGFWSARLAGWWPV